MELENIVYLKEIIVWLGKYAKSYVCFLYAHRGSYYYTYLLSDFEHLQNKLPSACVLNDIYFHIRKKSKVKIYKF